MILPGRGHKTACCPKLTGSTAIARWVRAIPTSA